MGFLFIIGSNRSAFNRNCGSMKRVKSSAPRAGRGQRAFEKLHPDANLHLSQAQNFHQLANQFLSLSFTRDESTTQELNQLLDDLNALDYSLELTEKEEAERLLCHGVRLLQLGNELMMIKFCHLIVNIVNKQQIMPRSECLIALLEYLIGALRRLQATYFPEILTALGAVLYETNVKMEEYWDCLVGAEGMLTKLTSSENSEIKKASLKCLENFTMRCPGEAYISQVHAETSLQIFLRVLQSPPIQEQDEISHCRVLISALKGMKNLITNLRSVHLDYLGELLAALKILMFYGVPGQHLQNAPRILYPTTSGVFDLCSPGSSAEDENSSARSHKKSEVSKKNRQKSSATKERRSWRNSSNQQAKSDAPGEGLAEGDLYVDPLHSIWTPTYGSEHAKTSAAQSNVTWGKVSSSESEYSDLENGQMARIRSFKTRVRCFAQAVLLTTVKSTERRIVFGYLPAFLPNSPSMSGAPQPQTLLSSILKDHSPKVRAGMLVVLTYMLDGSKQFLAAADDSEKHHSAFTPFSRSLASMIKELHRCLLLSLTAETSPLTLTQLIKCLSTVVNNVPYHKLSPGLLTKVVRHLKLFLNHRDSNVRVACLTSLGSVLLVKPSLPEVIAILIDSEFVSPQDMNPKALQSMADSGAVGKEGSPESEVNLMMDMEQAFGAMIGSNRKDEVELWLVHICKENVFPPHAVEGEERSSTVPLPVRLESLQVLAALVKNYFFTVRSSLNQITSLIHECLSDSEPSIMLHGARLFEQLGQAMLQELESQEGQKPAFPTGYVPISVEETVSVWLHLLDGPFPSALQNDLHPVLRATACDCLANIGPRSFELLPGDHRNLCISLILESISCSDNNVKAEAVRALGVYVLFPCLREDVCFLADSANSIITSMEDSNLIVRIKACWALGNLSDAFVLNGIEGSGLFADELSDVLLHKLCLVAISAAQDNDKVKSNAVRAIGNLLRFMREKTAAKGNFSEVIQQSIQVLIKNISSGTNMKVRWNACYAVGNLFRNEAIPFDKAEWLGNLQLTLLNVMQNCKNFKVRINAANALMVPGKRLMYGSCDQFVTIWKNLIIGLESGRHVVDFTEYNYRDNLLDQLCFLLCHLASMIEMEDLSLLKEILVSHDESLKSFLNKFKDKSENDEKDHALLTAFNHLEKLTSNDAEEMVCLQKLKDNFNVRNFNNEV